MRMSGNTILITGGTSGIGLELAKRFHADGNTVVVAGRREQQLTAVTAEHPGMDSVVLNVEDPDSIHNTIAGVLEKHPDLNVVINNAGIMLPEDLTGPQHLDVVERTVTTNLLGPIRLLTHVVPLLTAQHVATIINVSSGLAFVPLPMTPTYSATKAGLHSYTQSLRVQLTGTGVQVIELVPPAVPTDLMGQAARGQGMALEEFLTQVMDLLRDHPDAKEICVPDVLMMRNAEAEGGHDDVLTMMSGAR